MNESKPKRRRYFSDRRTLEAEATRARILVSAKRLIVRNGIDKVTIGEIAGKAGVAESTVYAAYKSKEGILRALMEQSLFGGQYRAAQAMLAGIEDPVQLIAVTARVARAVRRGRRAAGGRGRSSLRGTARRRLGGRCSATAGYGGSTAARRHKVRAGAAGAWDRR